MTLRSGIERKFLIALGVLSLADVLFLAVRMLITGTTRFYFIPFNLALAWVSLFFAGWLLRELKRRRWASGPNIILTILWLLFLPNTWYVLTDFIHVYPTGEINQLYDIVLISLMTFIGFILGFASLYMIHRELLKRLSASKSYLLIEAILLLSGFAIYIGRDLRWNSWDVIANPGGLVLNVSDQITDPFGHPRAVNITLLFFILLSAMYLAIWVVGRPAKPGRS